MDPRRFFIGMNWWGKLTGAFLGYFMAGSVGALIGIFVGNFFDHRLGHHFSRPHWYYHAEKRKEIQQLFFEATFSLLGLIAKADGRVSENEIDMTKTLMKEFGLNRAQKKIANALFYCGK
jgi:DnaJ like chaperone protein